MITAMIVMKFLAILFHTAALGLSFTLGTKYRTSTNRKVAPLLCATTLCMVCKRIAEFLAGIDSPTAFNFVNHAVLPLGIAMFLCGAIFHLNEHAAALKEMERRSNGLG